ncbi:MAG TPA: antibiotic biosynthesis monooxygenase [Dokdonella sp.]
MKGSLPGVIMLYRWRVRAGSEDQFVQAWSGITRQLRDERGSLGSRLHKGDDGLWYGYAQWPNANVVAEAFLEPVDELAAAHMRDAVIENFTPVKLDPVADFLVFS